MNTFSKSLVLLLPLAAGALVTGVGCGTKDFKPSKIFSLDNTWPFDDEDEPEEGIPVRIVGAWTDTVMTVPGQKAQRGFGGRLMFYGAKEEKPILVDGQLVVYAFDEAGRAPTDNKPTRRYVFPADQLKLRMSKSDIGASYSFWLPWDEAGGPKTEVSLICRFEPKDGAVITGEQTRHILPGAIATETAAAPGTAPQVPEGVPMRPAQPAFENLQSQQPGPGGVQTASYEAVVAPQATSGSGVAAPGATAPDKQMAVTSIALPNDFQLPDGVAAQPISSAASQAGGPRQAARSTAMQLQQPQIQQPATAMQPVMQTAQPPIMNGAAVMQQMPVIQSQFQPPNAFAQRPAMSPVNMVGTYAPQNQGFVAPFAPAPSVVQQPVISPAIGMAGAPQQPVIAAPMQPMAAIPAQQMAPQQQYQQGYQQLPATNGLRTAVSYGPPTIPWR
jgi:hypothetical protein